MIEARGGKDPYVYFLCAIRTTTKGYERNTAFCHSVIFDTADSPEEAEGRALKACRLAFPSKDGWDNHAANVKCLGGIDWISRYNLSQITVATPCHT